MPELRLKRRAAEQYAALPDGAHEMVDDVLLRVQASPREAGGPLRGSLAGRWRAYAGPYRILYRILPPNDQIVIVDSIRQRAEGYRRHST